MEIEIELARTDPADRRDARELAELARLALAGRAQETLEWMNSGERAPEGVAPASWVRFSLHPLAPPVELELATGRVVARALTEAIGPGYDAHVRRVVAEVAREVGLAVASPAPAPGDAEARSFDFLAREASRATPESGPHAIGAGPALHRYPEVPLATLLGSRDEAWRTRVVADPRAGADAFPWMRDGAEHLRGRALSLLWHAVRFRPPISEHEEELAESVLDDLRAAHREDPSLDYPAEAWAELASWTSGPKPPRGVVAKDRAAAPPGIRGAIGYRRGTVERALPAGFSIRYPGLLAEEDRDEGLFAFDLERMVRVAAFEADPDVPPVDLLGELEASGAPLELALPGLVARATLERAEGGVELTAIAATRGGFCVLTAAGADEAFVRAVAASVRHRV